MSQGGKKSVNRKLRYARMKAFLSVEQAALLAEVSPTTYTRWEQGHQRPHLASLGRLCKVFEATPVQLGFGDVIGDEGALVAERRTPSSPPPFPGSESVDRDQAEAEYLWSVLTSMIDDWKGMMKHIVQYRVRRDERVMSVTLSQSLPSSMRRRMVESFRRQTGYSLEFRSTSSRQLTLDELFDQVSAD
jgi:DNA-binding XRE family transcriptional regulator